MLSPPINLPKWLEENIQLLQPPINNHCLYNEDFSVMVVGGPNERTDYHINTTPEWFYQHKGAMILKVVDDGTFRDIIIREGDMFLLPANIPHNPIRFANTVGIVLEQKRPKESSDTLRWYCDGCKEIVNEATFHCTNLGTQVKAAVLAFDADERRRTCGNCGKLASSKPPEGSIKDPNVHE